MEEGRTEFHNYSETQPHYCGQKVLVIFQVKEGWVRSSRTSLGTKNTYSLSMLSAGFSKTIHSPEPPHLFYSKVTHLLSVEHSNDTFNSHTMSDTNPTPGAECDDRPETLMSDL